MSSGTRVVFVWILIVALVLTTVGGALAIVAGLVGERDAEESRSPQERSQDEPEPVDTEPEQGSQDPREPALEPFYTQELGWEPCEEGSGYWCTWLEVPLDYTAPEGETIRLRVLKNPADEPDRRLGALVVNPGGPGAGGTWYAEGGLGIWGERVSAAYDLVGWDPRGSGASAPVDCLDDAELSEFIASDPTPEGQAEVAGFIADQEEFFAGCAERSGPVAGHVSSVETVRDMDVLRAALGESELDFFGASYGTFIGSVYAELHPDRVGRMVLDGGIDPSLTAREKALAQAEGFQTALEAYVSNCVEDDGCFLGGSVDEGLQRISGLLEQLDEQPMPAGGGRELTLGEAFYGLVQPLYVVDYWVLLNSALRAAFDGNGAPLLQLADLYFSRRPDGSYTGNLLEAILSINCLDDPTVGTVADVEEAMPAYREASPVFGEFFAWGELGCPGLEFRPTEDVPEVDGAGAAPIVVVGTTRDPATPYEGAVALAEQLDSGVLVTREGDGHLAYRQGNDCVDRALEGYLVDGEAPEDGLRC